MKKILSILVSAILVISLAACGANTAEVTETEKAVTEAAKDTEELVETADTPQDEEKEAVTITSWFYADSGTAEVYEEWAEKVHEAYPWITMELEELPYDSGPEKFTVACATDTTPDIYIDGFSRIAPAVDSGITVDLSELYSSNADLFFSEPVDGVVDGQHRYLPTHTGLAYGVMYNKDLADKLGVTDMIPQGLDPWSYDEFLDVCRAAKAADPSVIPFNLYAGSQSSDVWYYSAYMANGAELLNADHTATVFCDGENKERAIETLNFYKTLIDEELVPAGVASMTDEDGDSFFCAGQLLFESSGSWSTSSYFNSLMEEGTCVPFTFEVAVLPTKDGKEVPDSAMWGTYGFCAFDHGEDRVEAAKLAIDLYLKDDDLHSQICTLVGKSPLLNTASVEYPSEHIADVMARGGEYTIAHGRSDFGILEPWWTDFRMTHYPQLQDFYTGKIDAETMLENWKSEAEKVIPKE